MLPAWRIDPSARSLTGVVPLSITSIGLYDRG
jgi:hypothetical protein